MSQFSKLQSRGRKDAPAEPLPASPPSELPSGGGSYLRQPDGSLKKIRGTQPAPARRPRASAAKET